MAIKVAVVRHGKKEKVPDSGTTSWGISARLTEPGMETARQVARRLVDILAGCEMFASSPLIRAQETIFVVMTEFGVPARDFEANLVLEPGLWSQKPATWYLDIDPEKYNNAAVYAAKPDEVEDEGDTVLGAIRALSTEAYLAGQETAVCVSHGGPLDAAIMLAKRALGQDPPITDLKEGEGAIFVFDEVGELLEVQDLLHC